MTQVQSEFAAGQGHTNEDNAEDDDDTSLLGGPVLALGQVADLAGDESGVDGGHCGRLRGSGEEAVMVSRCA